MAPTERISNFKTFYKYYLTEHLDPVCRALHFVGTSLVFVLLFWGIFSLDWVKIACIPLAGYGFAWVGHFFFEKNKPATFQYPLWSLGSDFVMYWHTITFQLPAKIKEAKLVFPQV